MWNITINKPLLKTQEKQDKFYIVWRFLCTTHKNRRRLSSQNLTVKSKAVYFRSSCQEMFDPQTNRVKTIFATTTIFASTLIKAVMAKKKNELGHSLHLSY